MNNQVFFSNRISSLAHVLGENLFQGDPLACRYVVIPNDQVKRFLIEYFADQWGIAAGIRFVQLSEMIKIVLMANFPKLKIPSSLELSFHIERAMKNFLKDSQIPEKSLVAYIKKAKDPEKRIRGLSVQLSKLFVKYGVADSIEWKEGWQKVLWDVTFTGSGLTLPCMLEKLSFPHPIHFFYLSNLTSVQCELFSKIDCTFYQWSPCLFYWEDIKSDKERLFQKKKAGKFAEELDQYLKETNRFLANFGKVGRKWAQITSRYDWVEDEQYCVAEEPNTMLEQLQSDLLMLKEPGKFVVDDSIKVHAASCKRREVEVVKEQICRWLEKGVEPKEVLIMAPDIMEYAPYLEMVFEEWVSIGDLNKGARSVLVGAFTHLIGMESFDVMEVFTLFHFSCFQKKFGLSRDDVEKMQKWVEKADIRRGIKSWENGFARLLHGLAYSGDEYALEVVPVDCVEFSDAPLLGTLIDVVRLLEKELGKESRSLEKWLTYFRGLIEKFFVVSSEDEWFVRELETIGDLWGELKGEEFSFDSVRRILEHISSNCSGIYRGGEQQAIRCFNLNLDGSFDAKVICLLGMDEGSFPRKEKVVSLDMSSEVTTEEIDRYLFLQCLMQAEKGLIMSYVHISRSDQQTLLPSLFIQELFSYLGCEPLVMHPHFSPDRAQRG